MFTFQEIPLLDVGVVIPCILRLRILKELNTYGNNASEIITCHFIKMRNFFCHHVLLVLHFFLQFMLYIAI